MIWLQVLVGVVLAYAAWAALREGYAAWRETMTSTRCPADPETGTADTDSPIRAANFHAAMRILARRDDPE